MAAAGLIRAGEGGNGVVQSARRHPDHADMYTYRATVTLPIADRDRAISALRQEVVRLSTAERGLEVPDWSTMSMTGPEETYGPRGEVLHEYRGTVQGRNYAEQRAERHAGRT
jgi:hypothetical protein